MRRTIVLGTAGRPALAQGSDAIDQRATQVFELHDSRLLLGHDIVELMQHLVLVRQPRFEVDEAFLAHGHPLFTPW